MPRSYGTTNMAPFAVAPAVGPAGDTYFNTTDKRAYVSDGTVWISTTGPPAGVIQAFGGLAAPAGYLMCDGTAYSRTTYAGLFAAISTRFGTGDGSTTFNVPNLQGRMPVGYDGSAQFSTVGTAGGARTVALSTNEMPSHNHGGATGTTGASDRSLAHQHSINADTQGRNSYHYHYQYYGGWDYVIQTGPGGGGVGFGMVGGDRNISQVGYVGVDDRDHGHHMSFWSDSNGAPDHLHGGSGISAQGGGAAFSLLNPYVTVNFIIRI